MNETCDRVQLALVGGTADDADRAHAAICDECGFVAAASRRLRSVGTSNGQSVGAIEELLAALARSDEPLLDRYLLQRRLGGGGQGIVWRARDVDTGEDVAVKVVSRIEAETRDASADEVVNARRVRHPAVCRVYHSERHGRLRVIVMEYIDGRALADLLPLPLDRALAMFCEIATALHAGHEAGVLHLDLKPENVLVRADGNPVVTDFGLSVRAEMGRSVGGTPQYMAPEAKGSGNVDRRADVFALGMLLQRMVADPPGWLSRTIDKATAQDPRQRPATALALVSAVDRRAWRRRWIKRSALALGAVTTALVAALLVVPAPIGARAPWRADLWGPDRVPADLTNVAVDREGEGLSSVKSDGRGFGCAHNLNELIDGITTYSDWEHGFALAGREAICVDKSMLSYCGGIVPGRSSCRDGQGQVDPAGDCSERTLEVDLGDAFKVGAVRTWYHGGPMVPAALRIQVETSGGFRDVFATRDNTEGMDPHWYPGGMGGSVPVTNEFAPVITRRVRIIVDPCSTRTDGVPGSSGNVVWFYEIEVLARLGRLEAWKRRLFD